MEEAQGTSGNSRTPLQIAEEIGEKNVNHAEVEAEFHIEEEKAAEIKSSYNVKVQVAESTRAVENTA